MSVDDGRCVSAVLAQRERELDEPGADNLELIEVAPSPHVTAITHVILTGNTLHLFDLAYAKSLVEELVLYQQEEVLANNLLYSIYANCPIIVVGVLCLADSR